jgi:hypothetical protein
MMLNIGATGSIKPYVKFNAKADKWFAKGETGDVEIGRPTFVADLANIATGWLRFREGQAPERVIDPSLERAAPCPDEGFKRGFVLAVYSQKFFGGLAELSSASIHMGNALRELYADFERERASHPGQVPVIAGAPAPRGRSDASAAASHDGPRGRFGPRPDGAARAHQPGDPRRAG